MWGQVVQKHTVVITRCLKLTYTEASHQVLGAVLRMTERIIVYGVIRYAMGNQWWTHELYSILKAM